MNSPQKNVRFMAVGDMMFCCDLGEKLRSIGDYDYPFDKIKDFLKQADFLYGNLETMITTERKVENFAKPGLYYADPPAGAAIARAGFNAVSMAHNHMYDFGPEAVELTQKILVEQGVKFHGIGKDVFEARNPLEVQVNGLKIGMLNYCSASTSINKKNKYVTCPISSKIIQEDVSRLTDRVDFVIVTLHEGTCPYPSPPHRSWAKAAVDAGAKIVLGHHPHVINGIEEYNGAVIAYGLADFISTFEDKKSNDSFVMDCLLKPDRTIDYHTVPVFINDDLQVVLAQGADKERISSHILSLSEQLKTGESDKEYWRYAKNNYAGLLWRDTCRQVHGAGIAALFRKIKKLRWHHVQILFRSVFGKF